MTSQRKNGHNSVGTLYRVVLGEMAFHYNVNLQQKEQGAVYILTYKANEHRFISVWKLKSGFTW